MRYPAGRVTGGSGDESRTLAVRRYVSERHSIVKRRFTMIRPRYSLPLTAEQLDARKTMPRIANDWILGLPWCVDADVRRTEPLWREWCKTVPKHLYPDWMDTWADVKRKRGL